MLQLTSRKISLISRPKDKKTPEKGGKLRGSKLVVRVTMFTGKLIMKKLGWLLTIHLVLPDNSFPEWRFHPDAILYIVLGNCLGMRFTYTREALYQNSHLAVWSSGNILPFSERLYPRAKIRFLLVSIRQFLPCSTLWMVRGETPAFLPSSALLMRSFSLIFLILLMTNSPSSSVYLIFLDIIIHIL